MRDYTTQYIGDYTKTTILGKISAQLQDDKKKHILEAY